MAGADRLTPRSKEITLAEMREYSGPGANLHTDYDVAEAFGFSEPIAQGLQLLGYVSEWLFESVGEAWLDTGRMDVSFVNPVFPGDTFEMTGAVAERRDDETVIEIECRVPAEDRTTIVGTATVGTRFE